MTNQVGSSTSHEDGKPTAWWKWVWGGNAWFLFCSIYAAQEGPGEFFARPFSLGNEMNFAAWWSGFQFLLFGLLAWSLAGAARDTDRTAYRALLALGAVGLTMFADEIGSIHERVNAFIPLEGDLALIPFGVVGGAVVAYGIHGLYSRREAFGRAWLPACLGFVVLASVYVQEFAEHRVNWPRWSLGMRVAAEEGTELTGVFLLLYSIAYVQRRLGHTRVHFLPGRESIVWATWGSAALAIPVLLIRCSLTPNDLNLPAAADFGSVIPVFLFGAGALIAAGHATREGIRGRRWWIVPGTLMLLSLDAEARFHHYVFYGATALRWRPELGLLWGVPLLTVAATSVHALRHGVVCVSALATAVLVAIAAVVANPVVSWVVTYLVAFAPVTLLLWGASAAVSPYPGDTFRADLVPTK